MAKEPGIERDYTDNVGHPPVNLPDDHPDAWMWEYDGTSRSKKKLKSHLGVEEEVWEQPSLFDELPPAGD